LEGDSIPEGKFLWELVWETSWGISGSGWGNDEETREGIDISNTLEKRIRSIVTNFNVALEMGKNVKVKGNLG